MSNNITRENLSQINTLNVFSVTVGPPISIIIYDSKKGILTHTGNRLQRWGTILLNHDFTMKYQKIGHVDGLSRWIAKKY